MDSVNPMEAPSSKGHKCICTTARLQRPRLFVVFDQAQHHHRRLRPRLSTTTTVFDQGLFVVFNQGLSTTTATTPAIRLQSKDLRL
ncbi:unnamed protein product [Ilex paraguariensis]|uniref:Uncharacterized protein n=1 Tax=Ilex paraguariensis TaxID=185542 RepID=A0ABC8UXU0_9AQUA